MRRGLTHASHIPPKSCNHRGGEPLVTIIDWFGSEDLFADRETRAFKTAARYQTWRMVSIYFAMARIEILVYISGRKSFGGKSELVIRQRVDGTFAVSLTK